MTRRAGAFVKNELKVGGLSLNVEEQELSGESAIRLGGKEAKLMKLFMMNEGKESSAEELFRRVWADEPDMDRGIVWMYVSFLREKIESVRGGAEILGGEDGPFVLRAEK